jgi:hypothetical protein
MHNQLPKTALLLRDGWSSQAQNEQVEILNFFDSLTSMFRFSTNYKVGVRVKAAAIVGKENTLLARRLDNADRVQGIIHRLPLDVSVGAVGQRLLPPKDCYFGGFHSFRQLLRINFKERGLVLTLPVWKFQVLGRWGRIVLSHGRPPVQNVAVHRLHKRPMPRGRGGEMCNRLFEDITFRHIARYDSEQTGWS